MKILVTGGAGFIGSHLVDALVDAGHQVRVLDSLVPQVHGSAPARYLNPAAELIRGDVADYDLATRALDGIEVVYHEAAEVGVGQSMYEMRRYTHANTYGTAVLLEAILAMPKRIRRFIVASSMSIYGEGAYSCPRCGEVHPQLRPSAQLAERRWEMTCPNCGSDCRPAPTSETKPLFPTSIYAITKQDQEQFALVTGRAYDIPTVALRYFNVYGRRQSLSNPYTGVCAIFSSRLLNDQRPVVFEDGEQSRDFVHVSDIVRANLLAMESDRAVDHAINIGTGTPTAVREAAERLAAGLKKDLPPEIVGRYREGDIRHCVADITRARTLLGYEPQVTLDSGLPDLLEWLQHEAAEDRVATATTELEQRGLVR
jgi:dTDP-L-rhamnose 4-epimerase